MEWWLISPEAWMALATLTALEIVLGIDNIVFTTILVGRLEKSMGAKARTLGGEMPNIRLRSSLKPLFPRTGRDLG